MEFSKKLKEELCKFNNYDSLNLISEIYGFFLCANCTKKDEGYEIVSKNMQIIAHIETICKNIQIKYNVYKKGNLYCINIDFNFNNLKFEELNKKYILKGLFLGSGYVNEPEKNYHLEILFRNNDDKDLINQLFLEIGLNAKILNTDKKNQVYVKNSDEISEVLAYLGANNSVLLFEDIRVLKEMKNSVNRKVNCESANLNKTIDAAIMQINDIKFIKSQGKFDTLSAELQQIANLRLTHPELSLKDLGKLLNPEFSKSKINSRLKQIHEIAEGLR